MTMQLQSLLRGAAAILLLAGVARAQSETWSTPGDDRGWTSFGIAASSGVNHDGAGALAFNASDYAEFYIIADAGASGGLFTGSYTGYASLSFELDIAAGSAVDVVTVRLTDSVNFNEWEFVVAAVPGSFGSFTVPLDPSGAGWVQVAGPDAFATLLGSVDALQFQFLPLDVEFELENLSGTLDNVVFTPVPEPSTVALVAGLAALGGVVVARRRRVA